ncbi:hypothetical protein RAS1_37940 [Phycisphaerae bacterium RAS1]|nr:hypothetical protein RAS1_37940 [Phycisphaerae bacterium RAS1]
MKKLASALLLCAFFAGASALAGDKCCAKPGEAKAGEAKAGEAKKCCASAGEKAGCTSGDKGNVAKTGASEGGASCHAGDKTAAGDKAKCSAGSASAGCSDMPCIKYVVGEKSTCCPDEANKLANGDQKLIKYIVAEKSYSDEAEAGKAYADVLNKHLESMMQVKFAVGDECVACPMTAKELATKNNKKVIYRVAKFDFAEQAKAEEAIKHAKAAAEKVSMKMMVGDKCVGCPVEAKQVAEKEGKKVEYVVGEKRSCCETMGNVELAKARIMAAVKALEADANPGA